MGYGLAWARARGGQNFEPLPALEEAQVLAVLLEPIELGNGLRFSRRAIKANGDSTRTTT